VLVISPTLYGPSLLPIGSSRTRCLAVRGISNGSRPLSAGFCPRATERSRRSKTTVSVVCPECRARTHSHPPTAKSRTAAVATKVSTRRRWFVDCLRNSLNSWKHGLHEPRWSSQGSASVSETFPCAMPLSRELPGQPILSGLGNSFAKPRRRISSKRLSAVLDWLSLLRESQLANSSILKTAQV
jgi:hypothetical protein